MTEPRSLLERCRLHWDRSDKIRFLLVGAYNTVFGYVAFAGGYLLLGWKFNYLLIMAMAHGLAVCNAFVGHRILTFRVRGHLVRDFCRFNLSYLGSLLFGFLTLPAMVEGLKIHPITAQGVIVVFTTLASYFLHKRVSFRRG